MEGRSEVRDPQEKVTQRKRRKTNKKMDDADVAANPALLSVCCLNHLKKLVRIGSLSSKSFRLNLPVGVVGWGELVHITNMLLL